MEDLEKAAIVTALLEALEAEESRLSPDEGWPWRCTSSNRIDSARWHPQSDAAYRLAGRMASFRARRPGRW